MSLEKQIQVDWDIERQVYVVALRDVTGRWQLLDISPHNLKDLTVRGEDPNPELQRKYDELKEQMAKTIEQVNNKYKEALDEQTRLRAEAEERVEHLSNEVLDLRRELQGRNESHSGYVSTSVSPNTYTFTYVEPTSAPIRDVSSDSTGTAVPSSREDSSSSGRTSFDNSV